MIIPDDIFDTERLVVIRDPLSHSTADSSLVLLIKTR